ncbi:hypothetical protein D3C83_60590 [compost metagenome]
MLRTFGVAVTTLEDAVIDGAPAGDIAEAAGRARTLLAEMEALIERLRQQPRGASG